MYAGDLCLSLIIILFLILTSTNALRLTRDSTTTNSIVRDNKPMNESISLVNTSSKNPLVQGKEMINDAFAHMDRGTIIRGIIVLSGITGLILLYVGVKAFL